MNQHLPDESKDHYIEYLEYQQADDATDEIEEFEPQYLDEFLQRLVELDEQFFATNDVGARHLLIMGKSFISQMNIQAKYLCLYNVHVLVLALKLLSWETQLIIFLRFEFISSSFEGNRWC